MWDFLDKMDKNLLYSYAFAVSGQRCLFNITEHDAEEAEKEEQRKHTALYLIWFTYYHVLKCKTLEETIPYQNKETLKKYRLLSFLTNTMIFLCNGEICFRKIEDISMILEILYNRYDLWEQFDCFIRNTKGIRRKRCMEAKEKYQAIYRSICMKQSGKDYETDEEYIEYMFRETGTALR